MTIDADDVKLRGEDEYPWNTPLAAHAREYAVRHREAEAAAVAAAERDLRGRLVAVARNATGRILGGPNRSMAMGDDDPFVPAEVGAFGLDKSSHGGEWVDVQVQGTWLRFLARTADRGEHFLLLGPCAGACGRLEPASPVRITSPVDLVTAMEDYEPPECLACLQIRVDAGEVDPDMLVVDADVVDDPLQAIESAFLNALDAYLLHRYGLHAIEQ